MAADQKANERAYVGLKAAILTGDLRLRQRLDIEKLAQRFNVSATPVRQALAILAFERLVSVHSSRIYHVAFWSEAELHNLYAWRSDLARLALQTYQPSSLVHLNDDQPDYVASYAKLMAHIEVSANPELHRCARGVDDRLHAALRVETEVLQDAVKEMRALMGVLRHGGAPLKAALQRFFRRRADASARIRALAHARALPRNGD
jgi:DNA-binding GntR family transcriptional regulator